MKISLDQNQHKIMEELRAKFALLGFGVTYMDGKITLRWGEGNEVTFIPERFITPNKTHYSCEICGGNDDLMPAKVTIEQDNDGDTHSYEGATCTWCRCPQ